MKKLNKSYLVVILVIIFIGIAGGFTNSEYGRWYNPNESCTTADDPWGVLWEPDSAAQRYLDSLNNPFLPKDAKGRPAPVGVYSPERECEAIGGVYNAGNDTWKFMSNEKVQGYNLDTRTTFDPKSTALFAIAGVIVALVGLEMRKKK
jgi:hypothetical protein